MAARASRSGTDIQLRWWAVALPAAAFAALLALLASGAGADAAAHAPAGEGQHPVTQFVQHVQGVWLP
jgi:uncharacterized membrane protein